MEAKYQKMRAFLSQILFIDFRFAKLNQAYFYKQIIFRLIIERNFCEINKKSKLVLKIKTLLLKVSVSNFIG